MDELKGEGNKLLQSGDFEEAIGKYTEAIELDPDNHVLYSNRAAALTKAGKYLEALGDADKTIQLKPDWARVSLIYFIFVHLAKTLVIFLSYSSGPSCTKHNLEKNKKICCGLRGINKVLQVLFP